MPHNNTAASEVHPLIPVSEAYSIFGSDVHRRSRRAVGRADAEDVAQEAWVKVLRHSGFHGEVPAAIRWLRRVTDCAAIDWYRRHAARLKPSVLEEQDTPSRETGPEQDAIAGEATSKIYQAIDALSPSDRAMIVLAVNGLSHSEIAFELGITPARVRDRLWAARRRLAQRLALAGIRVPASPALRRAS